MVYQVKEIFLTLQGEGLQAGRASVFCRFAGCNLWSGREDDRKNAQCVFCDTDFVGVNGPGGGRFEGPHDLAAAIDRCWAATGAVADRWVVLTGGEPLLQVDAPLIAALHECGFHAALETNGTLPVPAGIDWVCVSPKAGTELVQHSGDELKVVFPQPGLNLEWMQSLDFRHFLVQPMDGPSREANTALAVEWCLKNPQWRLSLQTHKFLGIP